MTQPLPHREGEETVVAPAQTGTEREVKWAADARTPQERACCHMGSWEPFPVDAHPCHSLEAWRAEFRSIPRSEHCRDCPVFTGAQPARSQS